MKLLETEWSSYRRACIPANAPAVQITESRRAFFAGAWAFYTLVLKHLEGGTEETPGDLALMKNLDAEMREFSERVKRGDA